MKTTFRLLSLWSAVLGVGAVCAAQEPSEGMVLAAFQVPGLDLPQLNHFFDAARIRAQSAAMPRQAVKAPQAAILGAAAPPPAYRRTFRILLSHPETTDRYDGIILKYAQKYSLDARLLKSIIAAESEFATGAVSPRGARGLMQVMPLTAEEMGVSRRRLSEPESNIRAGAAYLARLFQAAWRRFKPAGASFADAPLWLKQRVIAAYNAGPRFLYHNRWYPQTRSYVRKVMLFYRSQVSELRRRPALWRGYRGYLLDLFSDLVRR